MGTRSVGSGGDAASTDKWSPERIQGPVLLGMTVLMAVMLARAPGTTDVTDYWLVWMERMRDAGLADGYALARSDYPPLSFVILHAADWLGGRTGLSPFSSLKAAILLFQFVAVAMLWRASGSALLAAGFNAAITLNGAALGYLDVFWAPPLIGALWAFRGGRRLLGFALFGVSCLVKWQPVIFAPFLLLHAFEVHRLDRATLAGAARGPLFRRLLAVAAVTAALLLLCFGLEPARAFNAATSHPWFSASALNLPWIEQYAARAAFADDFSLFQEQALAFPRRRWVRLQKLLFLAAYAVVIWRFLRSRKGFAETVLFAVAGLLTHVMVNAGVHENHLFGAVVLGFVLVAHAPTVGNRAIAWLLTAMLNVTLLTFYEPTGPEAEWRLVGIDLSVPLAALCVLGWVAVLRPAWAVPRAGGRCRSPRSG